MKPLFRALLFWLTFPLAGFSQEPPKPTPTPPPPFPRPSFFIPQKIGRDPFAPIRYGMLLDKKLPLLGPKAGLEGKSDRNLADFFDVSTISLGRLSIAVINKRAFAEGEYFQFKHPDGAVFMVRVLQITDGKVELDCAGQNLKVPLARKDPKSALIDTTPE